MKQHNHLKIKVISFLVSFFQAEKRKKNRNRQIAQLSKRVLKGFKRDIREF